MMTSSCFYCSIFGESLEEDVSEAVAGTKFDDRELSPVWSCVWATRSAEGEHVRQIVGSLPESLGRPGTLQDLLQLYLELWMLDAPIRRFETLGRPDQSRVRPRFFEALPDLGSGFSKPWTVHPDTDGLPFFREGGGRGSVLGNGQYSIRAKEVLMKRSLIVWRFQEHDGQHGCTRCRANVASPLNDRCVLVWTLRDGDLGACLGHRDFLTEKAFDQSHFPSAGMFCAGLGGSRISQSVLSRHSQCLPDGVHLPSGPMVLGRMCALGTMINRFMLSVWAK